MRRIGTLLAATMLAALVIVPLAARATTSPSEGTLSAPADTKLGKRAQLTYNGGPVGGALLLQNTGAEPVCGASTPPPGECDVFTLHLNIPSGYWTKIAGVATGHLDFSIDWDASPDNPDIDLIVFDANGNKVAGGETDNFSSKTHSESARLNVPDGGDYRVAVAGIVGGVSSYRGTIAFVLDPPQQVNVHPSTQIAFGPATVVDPTLFGGEPGLNGDPTKPNTWYIDWPVSSRAQMGLIHRSTDGGDTFRLMTDPACPQRRQPGCETGGGGDTEVAVSKGGTVFMANQEVTVNEASCTSPDRGITWPSERCHSITSLDPSNDRQWLAAYDDNTAYLAATSDNGESIAITEDGGKTWVDRMPLQGPVPDSPAAPIVMDATRGSNGTLYVATSRGPIQVNVSTDKAVTFTSFPAKAGDKTGLWFARSLFIPWLTKDTAGNLYAVWTDAADHAVYMSTMLASAPQNAGAKVGSTWSPPVRVSAAPARSTVLTQVIAGDPGHVAVAFQGADSAIVSDNVPAGTPWRVFASFSADALCWWSSSCKGSDPAFEQTLVSSKVNHTNEICVSGIGCTANGKDRSLLDFFDIGIDTEGRVGVVWTDTENGLKGGTIMFARVLNGPSLFAGKSFFGRRAPAGATKGHAGDAVWPLNGTPGSNNRAADVTGDALTAAGSALKVSVNIGAPDLSAALDAGYDTTHVKYVTRWSYGDQTYFVAADTTGAEPTFYGGKIDDDDAIYSPLGANVAYGMKYNNDFDVSGTFANGVLSFTVPRDVVGDPKDGDTLYSVQTFTIAGVDDALQTLYTAPDTIDATPPIDVRLGTTSVLGKHVTKPKVSGKKTGGALPSTGDEPSAVLAVALLGAAAATIRLARRRA